MEDDEETQEAQDPQTGAKDQDAQDDGQKNSPKGMNNRKMPVKGEEIYKGVCNVRIHELAQPKRWFLLYTYKNYRQLFESERAQAIKEKVQELFGMTPEEAELYFNKIRQKRPNKCDVRLLRQRIYRERKAGRKEAYCIFNLVIKKAMRYAYRHSPPLLVTPMLRMVSDHMLGLLADLHGIDVPKRSNCDNISTFLISIADWCALFVSNIYYELEVEDRKEAKLRLEEAAIPCSDTTVSDEKTNEEKKVKLVDYDDGEGVDDDEAYEVDQVNQQQE